MRARADGERTALKEWVVLIDAIASGEIIAMVRKGGIREQRSGFSVRHERFLLYPTVFHERPDELSERVRTRIAATRPPVPASGVDPAPAIQISILCEVAAVWAATDLARVLAASDEYGVAPAVATARFNYRNRPGVHVVAVRARRLAEPVDVPEIARYRGCVSWVELDRDIDVAAAEPVLPAPELSRRVAGLAEILGPALTDISRAPA